MWLWTSPRKSGSSWTLMRRPPTREVMLESYSHLVSVGYDDTKPEVILKVGARRGTMGNRSFLVTHGYEFSLTTFLSFQSSILNQVRIAEVLMPSSGTHLESPCVYRSRVTDMGVQKALQDPAFNSFGSLK
ncbi:RB-associated KRAB zinc finger protein [Manis javanica]|nr:RB-associated KRAB zinc finger protein [Manis javanica]